MPVGEAIAFIQGEGEEVPERSEGGGEEEAEEGGDEDGGGAQATATETEAPRKRRPRRADAGGRRQGRRALQGLSHSPQAGRRERPRPLQDRRLRPRRPHRGARRAGRHGERNGKEGRRRGAGRRIAAPEQPQAEMQGFQPARLPEPTEEPGTQLVEPTRMMQVIGERMTESKQHVPHFYATVEVRMDAAMALRKQLNEQLEDEGIKLSVNDFVMKACAVALRKLPEPERPLHHPRRRVAREGGHGHGGGPGSGPHNPRHKGHRKQGPRRHLPGVQGSRLQGARRQAPARRVPGRHHHRLQHGHVRHRELHRHHQPAAGRHRRRLSASPGAPTTTRTARSSPRA